MRPKKLKKRKNEERVPSYGERFEKRFEDFGGRLFVADLCKSRVLGAVRDTSQKRGVSSCLCVARDLRAAEELQMVLFPGEDVRTITSVQDLLQCLAEIAGESVRAEDKQLRRLTKNFAEYFPRLIVCFENDGQPVLHASICLSRENDSMYTSVEASHFCVSDLLSACRYQMTVLDEVYGMMDFTRLLKEERYEISPLEQERMSFGGAYYVSPISHSYKKLLKLADSSEYCVALSDILMDRNTLNLYAVMNLLCPAFSYRKAKDFVTERSDGFGYECDLVYTTLDYSAQNDTILSICLRELGDWEGVFPDRIDDLSEFVTESFSFLSREEVFLMAVYLEGLRLGGNIYNNNEVIRYIEEDEGCAMAFCDILFGDRLKGKLEKSFRFHLNEMTARELLNLRKLAEEKGCFAEILPALAESKTVYLYHDESAFEDLLRCDQEEMAKRLRCGKTDISFDGHENAYSVFRRGKDDEYACVCIKQIMEDQGLETPVLVVSDQDEETVCRHFSELLPGTRCSILPAELLGPEENRPGVITVNYEHLRSLSPDIPVKTVFFVDGIYNVELFNLLLRKVSLFNGGQVAIRILVNYRNLSGHMGDLWSDTLFGEKNTFLPVDNADLSDSEGVRTRYDELVREIDEVYEEMELLTEEGGVSDIESLAERYRSLTVRFPTGKRAPQESRFIISDLSFLSEISAAYRMIYSNSVTVGSAGYAARIISCKNKLPKAQNKPNLSPKKINKREKKIFKVEESGRYIEFNVCSEQACGRCSVREHDCGDCQDYQRLLLNRFDVFSAAVEGYFSRITEMLTEAAEEERRREGGMTINDSHSRAKYFESLCSDVTFRGEKAQAILEMLKEQAQHRPTLFFAEYDQVAEIRRLVRHVYLLLFGEYYAILMETLKNASEQMKTALETAAQAGASTDAKPATT